MNKHVVIIGGGFGGLQAATRLKYANVNITLIDRRNHHLFQPLLYQVATGALSPADIATPLRSLLQTALTRAGYRTLEAPGILEANALLAHEHDLALIVADARLGSVLWELTGNLRVEMPDVPLIVLVTRAEDEEISFDHGARAVIQQPFQTQQFLACVAQFAPQGE